MPADSDLRRWDPGALVIGVWLAVVGIVAMAVGQDDFPAALPYLGPLTLVVLGIGLAVPTRTRRPGHRS